MLSKNLKYFRLKKGMSMKELAEKIGVSAMTITYYEKGERKPDYVHTRKLAEVLEVQLSELLTLRLEGLDIEFAEFRKGSKLSKTKEEVIKEGTEEYFSRFFTILNILGEKLLPDPPAAHTLNLDKNNEKNAMKMRKTLNLPAEGPVGNLVNLLENKGILLYGVEFEGSEFSGMNGMVNGRPFILYNKNMSVQRIRSTIAHELAHYLFNSENCLSEKENENIAMEIGGAFLLPKTDLQREIGNKRANVTDLEIENLCKEYGISSFLAVKRAEQARIFSRDAATKHYIKYSGKGWRKDDPWKMNQETPSLFESLVLHAVGEEEISILKGAELLKTNSLDIYEKLGIGKDAQ